MFSASNTKCLYCGNPVKGRTDKKFCNDYCRNNYNNQLKSKTVNIVRNINNALVKNIRILEGFIQYEKTTRVPKDRLIENGFTLSS